MSFIKPCVIYFPLENTTRVKLKQEWIPYFEELKVKFMLKLNCSARDSVHKNKLMILWEEDFLDAQV